MTNVSRALGAVAGLLMLTAAPAKAADPLYCDAYAALAVAQFQMAIAKQIPVAPPRWQANYNAHRTWCLLPFVTRQTADTEIAARHSVIN